MNMKVSLREGLNTLQIGKTVKLFSDGLDNHEYIYFDKEKGWIVNTFSDKFF